MGIDRGELQFLVCKHRKIAGDPDGLASGHSPATVVSPHNWEHVSVSAAGLAGVVSAHLKIP